MLKERRRSRSHNRPKRQEQPWRPWFRVEYVLFLITFAAAVLITLSLLISFWLVGAEKRRAKEETAANQQPFVTYFRHVVGEGGSSSAGDSAEGEAVQDTRLLLNVDLSQYQEEGADEIAVQVYGLMEQHPQEIETILSWYENAQLYENNQWTTVGEAYPEQAIPERLLKLVLSNEETIPVVAQYPYRDREGQTIDLQDELGKSSVPLLLQWDPRWAFESYGDGLLCYTGCGPTCLAMVALHLNQDSSITPLEVARYADQEGYYTDGVGSAWTLMSDGSWHFGLVSQEISVNEEKIREQLELGNPLICAVGAGDFTESGHFIVITGYQDGAFTINDPNSRVRSEQPWTFEQLSGQIRVMWAFWRSGES